MTKLDQESRTLLTSFSQLQPDNENDMTVHSLANFLPPPPPKQVNMTVVCDKENLNASRAAAHVNYDHNNYLTLGDLQKVDPPATEARSPD